MTKSEAEGLGEMLVRIERHLNQAFPEFPDFELEIRKIIQKRILDYLQLPLDELSRARRMTSAGLQERSK